MSIDFVDLYDEIRAMRGDVGRLITSVTVLSGDHEDSERRDADFELRLRSLEKFKYTIMGAVLILNAALFVAQWALFNHK